MGRLLILVVLVAVVAWMVMSRRRPDRKTKPPEAKRQTKTDEPARMLVCAHCGVHLPQSETVSDAEGRAYCTEAHRLAGPR
jgi:uncharacterized protein